MYQPTTVDVIELTLPASSIKALEEEPENEYQPGEFSLAESDGTPAGVGPLSAPLKVGVRLKGHVGSSFRPLSEKAAFKIKFNKKERYLGLKKMTLNNMVEDTSMIHETLAYSLFRAAGVPASHTGFAYLRVNGEDYGLYLNIETLDDLAMEKRFGPFEDPQHLYEGESGSDVTPGGATAFEVDEGSETDLSDLEALIEAVNSAAGPTWLPQVTQVADLQEMTRMWAVEKYIGFWDGYAGQEGPSQPNNFDLYSDPLGVFQILPWGADQTWERRLAFDGDAGLMFNRCLEDPGCEALYREALGELHQVVAGPDLDSLAKSTAELLKPWQELDPRREYSLGEIKQAVAATHTFIADRRRELAAWLGIQEPEPPESSVLPIGQVPGPAPRPAHVDHSTVTGGILITHLVVPGAGKVSQQVKMWAAGGPINVCVTHEHASEAGGVTLRCELSPLARRHLRKRWLRLNVYTTFAPLEGSATVLTRGVVARRVGSP